MLGQTAASPSNYYPGPTLRHCILDLPAAMNHHQFLIFICPKNYWAFTSPRSGYTPKLRITVHFHIRRTL